jgi:cytochrome c
MTRMGLAMLAGAVIAVAPASGIEQESSSAPVSQGERAFQKCYSCHSLGETDEGAQGPSLKGIVGRAVASSPGYGYSPALRAYAARQPRWTRAALNVFLADPQSSVPDSAMGFFGLKDPKERAALIDYLATR